MRPCSRQPVISPSMCVTRFEKQEIKSNRFIQIFFKLDLNWIFAFSRISVLMTKSFQWMFRMVRKQRLEVCFHFFLLETTSEQCQAGTVTARFTGLRFYIRVLQVSGSKIFLRGMGTITLAGGGYWMLQDVFVDPGS